jgi:hypothetical protein
MREKRGDRGGRRNVVDVGGGDGLADGGSLSADSGLVAAWVARLRK